MNTPLHIQLLLHCHAIAEPIPNRGAPAVEAYLRDLVDAGLIGHAHTPSGFQATDKGRDYVSRLTEVLSLPDPTTPLTKSVKKAVPPSVRRVEYPRPRADARFLVTRGSHGISGFRLQSSEDEALAEAKKHTEASGTETVVWKPIHTVRRVTPVEVINHI